MPMDNTCKTEQLDIVDCELEYVFSRLNLLQHQRSQKVTPAAKHLIESKFDSIVTLAVDLDLLLEQHTEHPTRDH